MASQRLDRAGPVGEVDFRAFFERAPGLYLILDPRLRIAAASDAYCTATMTLRSEMLGRGIFDVFPDNPEDPAADGTANLRASLERVLRFKRPDAMAVQKYDVRKPDDPTGAFEERYWSPLNSPILDDKGEVRWIVHSVEDVTRLMGPETREPDFFAREQQRSVDRLRDANREIADQADKVDKFRKQAIFFYLLVQSSTDAIVTLSQDGVVLTWNRAAETGFGYSAEEMSGRTLENLPASDQREANEALDARLRAGGPPENLETAWRRKDGQVRFVSMSVAPIRDEKGAVVAISKIVRDITEQREADDKLRALQEEVIHIARWNTMGMMASTIAHELNQPLTAIMNYVKAARRTLANSQVPQATRVIDYLDRAANETKLAGGITRTLRDFIVQRKTSRSSEDLNALVRETAELGVAGRMDVRPVVKLELGADLAPVVIDKVQIQQVLLNLVRNSVDAMQNSPHRSLVIATSARDGGFIEIGVADSGPGLSPEVEARLFQPFVSTKENGMGVGLTICQSIVEAHGGRIWAEPNSAGSGVVFRFLVPSEAANEARHVA